MEELYYLDLIRFLDKIAIYIDQQQAIYGNNEQHSINVNTIEYFDNGIYLVEILVKPSTLGKYVVNYITENLAKLWENSTEYFELKNTYFYYNKN